jgi:spore maturation protein CgeB
MYYADFLESFYREHLGLADRRYKEQLETLLDACFGTSDFYSRHLNALGCEAHDLVANCVALQRAWARENGTRYSELALKLSPKWARLPILGRWLARLPGLLRIAVDQVRAMKPDVLYCQSLTLFPPGLIRDLKPHVRLVVGQIAYPMPPREYLEPFDLILTSFPHFVSRFRRMGIASEYLRIGFDDRVLEKLGIVKKSVDVSFVGGFSAAHGKGTALLEFLARNTSIEFFGYGRDALSPDSPIRARHRGEVWGMDMYRALASSRVTVNRHIDVAENYANNMRLYEATGVGAMLVTDWKKNLGDLFDIGSEVVAYRSPEEACELVRYYANHPEEAAAIAHAGQARTLREHTYLLRMKDLVSILRSHLK